MSERRILGFLQDDAGEWVADLSCGHRRHVRHRPPFEVRTWVLDDAGRSAHVGNRIDCFLCADEPEGGEAVRDAALVRPECGTVRDDTRRAH